MSDQSPQTGGAPAVAGLRAPAHALDSRVRSLWTLQALGSVLVAAAGSGVILFLVDRSRDDGLPLVVWIVWGTLAAGAALTAIVGPPLCYRWHRWEVTPLGLYVQRGLLRRTWTIVPHSRIQAVDTTSGFFERHLDLATVNVRTASGKGSGTVPGLSGDSAAGLTRELAAHAGEGEAT